MILISYEIRIRIVEGSQQGCFQSETTGLYCTKDLFIYEIDKEEGRNKEEVLL
jgi:hypothetical protein